LVERYIEAVGVTGSNPVVNHIFSHSSVVEQTAVNRKVLGSNPNERAKYFGIWPSWLRHLADIEEIKGSNPFIPTKIYNSDIAQWLE